MHLPHICNSCCVSRFRVIWTFSREATKKRSFANATISHKLVRTNFVNFAFRPPLPTSAASSEQRVFLSSMSLQEQNQSGVCGPIEETIREKLWKACAPVTHLTIINESHRHNVYGSLSV
jgi:hypothetical protein